MIRDLLVTILLKGLVGPSLMTVLPGDDIVL